LKAKLFNSISEIPRAQWNQLLNDRSCTFSHEFWELIEQAGLNDFHYRHVLFLGDDDQAIGFASFYSVTTDIAIFAPLVLRNLLAKVRRYFPNFLKLRMLECGTPIILNSPPIVAGHGIDQPALIEILCKLLAGTARAEGQWLIVIRDFEANADHLRPEFARHGYHWVASLPNTYLDIRWPSVEAYRASLKSYYRSKLQKHLRPNAEQQVRHELVDDFSQLADQLCSQWLIVHNQADEFQREVLTPAFYREFSEKLGTRSKALLFYRNDQLVGHALILHDGDLVRWLYFGRIEAVNDSLYIYVAHAVVEAAIQLGARQLEMGLTTYPIKQDLGARAMPVHMAIRARSGLLNRFVGRIYLLLNRPPAIENKQIFKQGS
jgi:predicted N-acyltransferase